MQHPCVSTSQGMCVYRNTEALPFDQFCGIKTIIINQNDCVFVALIIHHAFLMRHILCGIFRFVLTIINLKTLEIFRRELMVFP